MNEKLNDKPIEMPSRGRPRKKEPGIDQHNYGNEYNMHKNMYSRNDFSTLPPFMNSGSESNSLTDFLDGDGQQTPRLSESQYNNRINNMYPYKTSRNNKINMSENQMMENFNKIGEIFGPYNKSTSSVFHSEDDFQVSPKDIQNHDNENSLYETNRSQENNVLDTSNLIGSTQGNRQMSHMNLSHIDNISSSSDLFNKCSSSTNNMSSSTSQDIKNFSKSFAGNESEKFMTVNKNMFGDKILDGPQPFYDNALSNFNREDNVMKNEHRKYRPIYQQIKESQERSQYQNNFDKQSNMNNSIKSQINHLNINGYDEMNSPQHLQHDYKRYNPYNDNFERPFFNGRMKSQMSPGNNLNNLYANQNARYNPMIPNSQVSLNTFRDLIHHEHMNNLQKQPLIGHEQQNPLVGGFNNYVTENNTHMLYNQNQYLNENMLGTNPWYSRKKRKSNPLIWQYVKNNQDQAQNIIHPSKYSSLDYIQGIEGVNKMYPSGAKRPVIERESNNTVLPLFLGSNKELTDEYKEVIVNFKKRINELDFTNVTVQQLKIMMREFGLNHTGKKNELIDRLKATLNKIDQKCSQKKDDVKNKEDVKECDDYGFYFF